MKSGVNSLSLRQPRDSGALTRTKRGANCCPTRVAKLKRVVRVEVFDAPPRLATEGLFEHYLNPASSVAHPREWDASRRDNPSPRTRSAPRGAHRAGTL
jgi:hypothetical protein